MKATYFKRGIGKSGRSRFFWKEENTGSNPVSPTNFMPLIIMTGALLTIYIATQDDLPSRDKFAAVVILGIICGVASLYQ